MTREELLRILDFADASRALAEERTNLSAVDARWNIISYSMRRHLEGKLLIITSAASAANVPYGTAMRRIGELIDGGFLLRRPRSKSGKSFSLHPTAKMIQEFESYAVQLKAHVGNTFGFNNGEGAIEDFYFGGSYMAPKILPFPSAMRTGVGYDRPVKILCPVDPTFKTLSDHADNLNQLCGTKIGLVNLPLDELHDEILANKECDMSKYDIISFDLPWIGELSENDAILPLNKIIEREHYNSSDFHTAAWKGSRYNGRQYGIPIQPTTELLFYRTDLFSDAGLTSPTTADDVLFAAKTLHRSKVGLSGIVMNFGRGTPVAHTFMQTLAAFGHPVINLTAVGDDFETDDISGESFRPRLCTEQGFKTASYLLELLDYAHPESMKCNWDRRIAIFAAGESAMTYGWSIRAAAFELDENSPAHDKVDFAPHPHGPGARSVSPIGGFSLAIPSNLPERQVKTAWKVMEYLTRPELLKWYVQNGNLTSPRFSTSADPEVQSFSKIIGRVDAMERRGQLQIWPRPPIPEFSSILNILGQEIHRMLCGDITIENALNRSQNQIDRIMRENGRY